LEWCLIKGWIRFHGVVHS